MKGLEQFDIIFTKPTAVYNTGDVVEGLVNIYLSDSESVTSIHIFCKGRAFVGWSISFGEKTSFVCKTDTFFNKEFHPVGNVLSTTDVTLDSGSYSFPFKFVIPSRAPYTYNGGLKCNIRYYVKAVIHRNCKSDKSTTASFMVNSVLRLEYVPNSLIPGCAESSKKIGALCWKSGVVTVTLHIRKRGFVPGENIVFDALIQNGTGKRLQRCIVGLFMRRTLYASHGYKDYLHKQINSVEKQLTYSKEFDWNNGVLEVPKIPPTLLTCDVIEIQYYVQLIVEPHNVSSDPISVTIGTMPHAQQPHAELRRSLPNSSTAAVQHKENKHIPGKKTVVRVQSLPMSTHEIKSRGLPTSRAVMKRHSIAL